MDGPSQSLPLRQRRRTASLPRSSRHHQLPITKKDAIAPSTVTHAHLLACIRGELPDLRSDRPLRVLDAGCGNCALLEYLHRSFASLESSISVELYGFDISDPHVQESDFLAAGVQRLEKLDPSVPWSDRTKTITANDPWPFPSDFFDIVVSNQVLEHVADHAHFFAQLSRVLRPGGVSLHCFPLEECLWEGHLKMPLVHRVRGHHQRRDLIARLNRLGFGRHRPTETGLSYAQFAENHADYLNLYTNYLGARELLRIAKRSRLRATVVYSAGLYAQKIRMLLGMPLQLRYRAPHGGALSTLVFWILKHVSSVTLRVQRSDAYRQHYL